MRLMTSVHSMELHSTVAAKPFLRTVSPAAWLRLRPHVDHVDADDRRVVLEAVARTLASPAPLLAPCGRERRHQRPMPRRPLIAGATR